MFLNQRSPLNLRVKSKKAELFFLNKKDALDISTNFPIIWKQISKKSLFNFEQIKRIINKVKKIFYGVKKPQKDIYVKKNTKMTDLSEYYDLNESELRSIPSISELNNTIFGSLNPEEKVELINQGTILKSGKSLNTIKESTLNDEYSYYSSSSDVKNKVNKSLQTIKDRNSEESDSYSSKTNDNNHKNKIYNNNNFYKTKKLSDVKEKKISFADNIVSYNSQKNSIKMLIIKILLMKKVK